MDEVESPEPYIQNGDENMIIDKCDKCAQLNGLWMNAPLKICAICYGANPLEYEALKALY